MSLTEHSLTNIKCFVVFFPAESFCLRVLIKTFPKFGTQHSVVDISEFEIRIPAAETRLSFTPKCSDHFFSAWGGGGVLKRGLE